jgi:hypothetical protein
MYDYQVLRAAPLADNFPDSHRWERGLFSLGLQGNQLAGLIGSGAMHPQPRLRECLTTPLAVVTRCGHC